MANINNNVNAHGTGLRGRASKVKTRSLRTAVASGIAVGATLTGAAGVAHASGTEYAHQCFPLDAVEPGVLLHLGQDHLSWLGNSAEAEINCGNGPYSGYVCTRQRYHSIFSPLGWTYIPHTCARTSGAVVESAGAYYSYPAAISEEDLVSLPESKGNHVSHYVWAFSGFGPA